MKIPRNLTDRVLVLGPTYENPRGGIAQVMNWHRRYVYETYHAIVNSASGTLLNVWLILWAMLRMTFSVLFHRRYSIIHIHTSARRSFVRASWFVSVAKWLRCKVVLHIHGGDIIDYCERHFEDCRAVLSRCDVVVVLDRRWVDYFKQRMSLETVVVVNNIVPPPVGQMGDESDDGCFHVVYLGRVVEDKGVFDLVEALAEHGRDLLPQLRLHVVGDGQLPQLSHEVGRLGLDGCVTIHGWLQGREKALLLNRCHAMVMPSHYEGISLSLLEAMSYHLPIVATNVGGNPTLVNNGLNGLLYDLGDNKQLISHLRYFVNNRDVALKMGQASEKVLDDYRPEVAAQQLSEIYQHLLSQL